MTAELPVEDGLPVVDDAPAADELPVVDDASAVTLPVVDAHLDWDDWASGHPP